MSRASLEREANFYPFFLNVTNLVTVSEGRKSWGWAHKAGFGGAGLFQPEFEQELDICFQVASIDIRLNKIGGKYETVLLYQLKYLLAICIGWALFRFLSKC